MTEVMKPQMMPRNEREEIIKEVLYETFRNSIEVQTVEDFEEAKRVGYAYKHLFSFSRGHAVEVLKNICKEGFIGLPLIDEAFFTQNDMPVFLQREGMRRMALRILSSILISSITLEERRNE